MRRGVVIATCLVGLIAVAGCGGGTSDTNTVSSTQANETTHRHHVLPCWSRNRYGLHRSGYGDLGYRYPGRILPSPGQPYVAPGEFRKDGNNMWWASDCHVFTVVNAGADGTHHADGLLAINRTQYEDPRHPRLSGKEIKVPGAGTLEITKAPLGPSVETWAQKRGNIEFKGEHGVRGTLHLKDGTVTLNR